MLYFAIDCVLTDYSLSLRDVLRAFFFYGEDVFAQNEDCAQDALYIWERFNFFLRRTKVNFNSTLMTFSYWFHTTYVDKERQNIYTSTIHLIEHL